LFTGHDLDNAQRATAALVLYVIRMGVDPRLMALATQAGPDEMRWLSLDEARALRVTYEPFAYRPWRLEAYQGGAIAITESNDGKKRIIASCSKRFGPNVALVDSETSWDITAWLEQCRNSPPPEGHLVFGTRVDANKAQVVRQSDGSTLMRFRLPTSNPPLNSPALLTFQQGYARACSTNQYRGSEDNFGPAVRLALRNCLTN
jgi:hypothetical protein